MSVILNLLLVTLVVCLSAKYEVRAKGDGVQFIDCYVCDPSVKANEGTRGAATNDTDAGSSDKETDDTNGGGCNKVNKGMIRRCMYEDKCSMLKIENSDEDVQISRHCGITDEYVKKRWEDDETEGEFETPQGLTSWMACDEDLCNWGVVNKAQMITLFTGAILSLSAYYRFV